MNPHILLPTRTTANTETCQCVLATTVWKKKNLKCDKENCVGAKHNLSVSSRKPLHEHPCGCLFSVILSLSHLHTGLGVHPMFISVWGFKRACTFVTPSPVLIINNSALFWPDLQCVCVCVCVFVCAHVCAGRRRASWKEPERTTGSRSGRLRPLWSSSGSRLSLVRRRPMPTWNYRCVTGKSASIVQAYTNKYTFPPHIKVHTCWIYKKIQYNTLPLVLILPVADCTCVRNSS